MGSVQRSIVDAPNGGLPLELAHFIREAVRRQVMGSDEAAGLA